MKAISAKEDELFMRAALAEAEIAAEEGEIPVGAVVVCNGRIIARAHNQTERLHDATAHAEMIALTSAQNYFGGKALPECTLYVTLEPCPMCAGAIGWTRIGRIVWGADDTKRGYDSYCHPLQSPLHPKTLITRGILAKESASLMRDFFRERRH